MKPHNFLKLCRPTGVTVTENIGEMHFCVNDKDIILNKINRPMLKYY